jgi:hypothetical protein
MEFLNKIMKEDGMQELGWWLGPLTWAAHSPNFNPLNFFLCVGEYHGCEQKTR